MHHNRISTPPATCLVASSIVLLLAGFCSLSSAEPLSQNFSPENSQETIQNSSQETLEDAESITTTPLAGGIVIEGDRLELYLDRKMRASGNAVIRRDTQNIYGNSIEYDLQNDELQVNGNVKIELGESQVSGPSLKMLLTDSIGEMKDASITLNKQYNDATKNNADQNNALSNEPSVYTQSRLLNTQTSLTDDPKLYIDNYREPPKPIGQASIDPRLNSSRGDAKAVFFEGQDKKRLIGARYTTCEPGIDDWYIKASTIELDDYTQSGTAKNATIEFKGVPLLYTPWMSFSFNNERKSGLLAPTVGTTSRSGFETLIPYYFNISPNMDATIGTRYLSKRGVQLQGEFRYLTEKYSGLNNVEYLDNDSLSGERRYYANISHRHQLSSRWSAGYNIEKVSDDQYLSEMSTRIISTSRVNLPQEGRVDYVGEIWQFNGLVQKYQTLDKISFPYQRLPQLNLSANKVGSYFDTNFQSQYTYFDRNQNAPLAVTGSRLVVNPSISVPFIAPYGFITPKIGIHATQYNLKNNNFNINNVKTSKNSATRTLPIFSVDSGLFFERDFNVNKSNNTKTSYTQTLEPRLFYVYIPDKNQDFLPVFDSALADLNLTTLFTENQFTGNDRVNDANQLSLAFTTRIIDKESGAERIAATIGQRYYFGDQNVNLPGAILSKNDSTDIIAALTARLSNRWNLDAFWQYNTDDAGMVRANILARYNPEPGKSLNIGYRYTQQFLEQINLSGQWPLSRGWYGVGRINYSVREKTPIESIAGLEYDAGCWQARTVVQRVETATADANYGLFFQLELGGLASIGSNPLNLLRRDIPGYLSSSEIPNIYRQQNYKR